MLFTHLCLRINSLELTDFTIACTLETRVNALHEQCLLDDLYILVLVVEHSRHFQDSL